jgi:hypothetical protein
MPSPFPGMDPFLEDPEVFPDFHDRYVTHLSESLQGQLPAPYYARLGRRVWIAATHRQIGPDVSVLRPRGTPGSPTGHAVAREQSSKGVVVHVPHEEFREPFIEVYAGRGSERRLVTTIELLSPANKTPGDQGRELYLRKQREMLASRIHLVEIDLLRGGPHTTAVPAERARDVVGAYDYHVCIHRFDEWEDYVIYPIRLEEPLPAISVPLLPEDAPVEVDLQAVFTRCYEAGPYLREIDYGSAVTPPLPGREEWLEERLASVAR